MRSIWSGCDGGREGSLRRCVFASGVVLQCAMLVCTEYYMVLLWQLVLLSGLGLRGYIAGMIRERSNQCVRQAIGAIISCPV